MANKYRKKQVRAPYRRFQGGDAPSEELGTLVYLGASKKKHGAIPGFETPALPLKLPLELLMLIVEFCTPEDALNLLLASKMWHAAALPKVYRAPSLTASNFPRFLRLLSTRKDLCALVKDLDLTRTIQSGKNSSNAKLLRSCSGSLLRFAAPQTNFGFSPMMALRSCKRLRILDLAYMSDPVELPRLFEAISGFHSLEVVRFPRNGRAAGDPAPAFEWPNRLESLALAGEVAPSALEKLPQSLRTLELQNCPEITEAAVYAALERVGAGLVSLAVHHPMPLLSARSMDMALLMCPRVTTLGLSIEYFSADLLDEDTVAGHPLARFTVHASRALGVTDKVEPEDLYIATEYLTELAQVRLSVVLGWTLVTNEVIGELAEVLDERGGGLYVV